MLGTPPVEHRLSIERELKLSFPPQALRAVRTSPQLGALKQGRGRTSELVSTYYDTRTRQLERAGVALRLRADGRRWTQTLKSAGTATGAMHERSEFEWTIAGPALELAHLAATPLAKLLSDIDARALQPALTTRFTRTTFVIAGGELRAEVAIDHGAIEAGTRRAPINEIELELQQGPVTALYDVAITLASALPLRPEFASKAERGFALRDRLPLRPRRAQAIELRAGESISDAAQRIIGACLTLMQANERGFLTRTDVEFLHQMRVGMRRLRVALACFRELLDPAELEAIKTELRWLGSQLGPARDWDVWATETLPAIARQLAADLPVDALLQGSRAQQRKARATARAAVQSTRYVLLLLRIGRAVAAIEVAPSEATDPPLTLSRFATRLLNKRHRALLRYIEPRADAGEQAEPPAQGRLTVGISNDPPGTLPANALHAARIAAKKLRYCAEFFGSLHKPKRVRRFTRSLAALQDCLGALNDASVARSLLARLAAAYPERYDPAALARIEGWLAGNTSARLDALPAAWRAWLEHKRYW